MMKVLKKKTTLLALMAVAGVGSSFTASAVMRQCSGVNPLAKPVGSTGATITPEYRKAHAFQGSNSAEIHQKFAAIQELNFSKPNARLIMSRLSDKELNDIAVLYNRSSHNNGNNLLRILAKRLDAGSLTRVAKVFGGVATQQAVVTYAASSVQKDFLTKMAAIPSVPAFAKTSLTTEVAPMAGPVPTSDMTLQEIYLEFRTAPVGSLSPASALSETLMFSGARLAAAWGVGYAVGTGIHNLIETYDPQFNVVLGGTIQQAFDNISAASTEYDQGIQESGADDIFGDPVGDSGDYSGDYGAGDSYDFYETGGGC